MTTKPNYLYLGPDKSGSSWIFELLRKHPSVFVPEAKDIYFFDRYYHFGLPWYLSHFHPAEGNKTVIGEICHDYLFSTEASERISRDLPDCRLMACLRNPLDRSYSHYLYKVRAGEISLDFEDAIEKYPEILSNSLYADNLQRYESLFDRKQLCWLVFDDLVKDSAAFAEAICGFLGIDYCTEYLPREIARPAGRARWPAIALAMKWGALKVRDFGLPNLVGKVKHSALSKLLYKDFKGATKPKMAAETRLQLSKFFKEDVQATSELIGRNLSHWLEK